MTDKDHPVKRFLPLLDDPFWPRSWAMELDNKKCGTDWSDPADR
jgi:hypothetical protein